MRKGEKSSIAVFWKRLETTDKATGEKKTIPMLRYYRGLMSSNARALNIQSQRRARLHLIQSRPLNPSLPLCPGHLRSRTTKPAPIISAQTIA